MPASTGHLPCVVCGIRPKLLRPNGRVRTGKCKQCEHVYNKEKQKKWNKRHTHCTKCGALNPSKAKHCPKCALVYIKRWQKKNPEKVKQLRRNSMQRRRDELRDPYIKMQLTKKNSPLTRAMVTPELISIKRAQLQLSREIRRQENGQD